MTIPATDKLQLRVLYRQFLFRMVDLELLSQSAQGDIHGLLSRFAALLGFVSLWLGFGVILLAGARFPPLLRQLALWGMEHFLIATTMLAVGLFAVVSWDSMFPDRRDVLILSPLPVRARTLFLAKAAAVAAALGLTVAVLNAFTVLASPLAFASELSLLPVLREYAAYSITVLAAGAFNFCLVLSIQGVAQFLPRQKFLRVSAILQIAALVGFVTMYCLQLPFASPADMLSEENRRLIPWLPSYWFLGLFQELNGTLPGNLSDAFAVLVRRAWIGLACSFTGAAAAYFVCYFRTLRKIAEQPDILPGSAQWHWLPRFERTSGNPLATAVVHFSIRTLFRSRRHRVTLAFYLGIAFAIVLFMTKAPAIREQGPAVDPWHQVNSEMMVASVLFLCAAVAGIRVAFAMPIDLRANWIFRTMPIEEGPGRRASVRRALYVLALMPAWVASAGVFFFLWPWRPAAEHLAILGLIGIILVEGCLLNFRKIPFTCSYLPGKIHFQMAIVGFAVLNLALFKGAEFERAALAGDFKILAAMLISLIAVAAFLRWWGEQSASEEALKFEDAHEPAVTVLGLNRDGTSPVQWTV